MPTPTATGSVLGEPLSSWPLRLPHHTGIGGLRQQPHRSDVDPEATCPHHRLAASLTAGGNGAPMMPSPRTPVLCMGQLRRQTRKLALLPGTQLGGSQPGVWGRRPGFDRQAAPEYSLHFSDLGCCRHMIREEDTPTIPSGQGDLPPSQSSSTATGWAQMSFPVSFQEMHPLLRSTGRKAFFSLCLKSGLSRSLGLIPLNATLSLPHFPVTPSSQGRCGGHRFPFRRGGAHGESPPIPQEVKTNVLQYSLSALLCRELSPRASSIFRDQTQDEEVS